MVGVRVSNALRMDVYVWLLIEASQHGSGKLLVPAQSARVIIYERQSEAP